RAGALADASERWLDDALYEIRWERVDADGGRDRAPNLAAALQPASLSRAANDAVARLRHDTALDDYDSLLARLESLCADYVERAFAQLGWHPEPGDLVDADALRAELGVLPRHGRLFARLLDIAGESGLLIRDGGQLRVARTPRPLDDAELRERRDTLSRAWGGAPELEMTARAGESLAAALRGDADPHELLFPGGSTENAERLYRDAAPARVMNGLLTTAVTAAVNAASPERPLRILEVGGGTGGTTAHLAPQLPADRVTYTFTDVGPLFVARARERLAGHTFMRFGVLDLEREPEAQGFAAGAFDLVIATNVIHATSALRATLRRLRRLLAPNGVLAM
ncbi:MAG: methyltransferase, partial [Gemmatimonadaceae bacterium]